MSSYIFRQSDTQYKYLTTNLLEKQWERLYKEPSVGQIVAVVLLYPVGMVTYSVAFLIRIMGVFKEAILLIRSFFSFLCINRCNTGSAYQLKKQAFIFGMSCMELASGMVGMACPPLAYKIDRFIYSYDVVRQASLLQVEWESIRD